MNNKIPMSVQTFRRDYRTKHVGKYYSGYLHGLMTFGTGGAIFVICLMQLRSVSTLEFLVVPITFLYANFVEYIVHQGPMHHPYKFMKLLFERHTLDHHHYFTSEAMEFESSTDVKMVLFPPLAIAFFFGGFAVPVGLLLAHFFSNNVSLLFVATAIGYFLNYEMFHTLYHTKPDTFFGRLWLVKRLRHLHFHHHDLALMSRYNFNITYPIFDVIFGSLYQGPKEKKSAAQSTPGRLSN